MKAQFWLDKWNNQETGFHLDAAHPLLKKFYSQVFSPSQGVFVPLCGKSSDLTFFAQKGSYTLGCELSEKAVEAFFSSQELLQMGKVTIAERSGLQSHRLDNIELLFGDYFHLQSKQLENCKTIYDRAALIALPEEMRKDYVEYMRLLMPSASMLLITLDFSAQEIVHSAKEKPPFSVTEEEVLQLFDFASVEQVYTKNIIEKEPRFKAKGLSYLNESAYVVRW